MESKDNADQIELPIQQINQLETIQGDSRLHQLEPPANAMEQSSTTKAYKETTNNTINEDNETRVIIKHLKDIKRQNFITQCLVSAMIVLTLTWQLSEVSLVLKVKDRITNPFKSFRDMFRGAMKEHKLKNSSSDQQENEGTLIPPIKLPELPILGLDNDEK